MAPLEIVLVPALSDNYVYLLHDRESGATAVVDPGEAAPVEAALAERGWSLTQIVNTHHHHDHTGGNADPKAKHGARLIGPRAEAARIAGMDRTVGEGDAVEIAGHRAVVYETPGHTSGHISLHIPDSAALFCGDTLFALGCGRMFEGTPPQFWASLSTLRALPAETQVYCGHEYTQSNARFALSVDGGNAALRARAAEIDRLRAAGRPTVPSTLADELGTNQFLRPDDPAMAAAVGMAGAEPSAVFAEIRRRKDAF